MKIISLIGLFILCLIEISNSQTIPVNEEKFVLIGGIEQWVTIKGKDVSRPVVLFLHGGPGSVMSPYDETIFNGWENNFILVQWDQRGAGRTFGKNAPAEVDEDYWIENPLTIDRMTADGLELTEHLVHHLKKEKIILIGTSWGSVLGVNMALQRPELFHAYIAHSQVVKPFDIDNYNKIIKMAEKANDHVSTEKLNSIGPPLYDDAKSAGQFIRIIKSYEKKNSILAPAFWWQIKPEYDNALDNKYREEGDDYSFINYVGHKKLGIKAMISEINFMNNGLVFKVPVYFIQGEHDILTPKEITKNYFNNITAPKKQYILIPGAAHGYNQAVVDAQYRILKSITLKD